MKNNEFVNKLVDIATKYKTLYVMGCFGAPLKDKKRWTENYAYNKKPERAAKINAASSDTFGFDCVCLIKAVLWGWSGDKSKPYGGAVYKSNGVPDIDEYNMINQCSEISFDFSNIAVGEAVWMPGHIGVYIGDGLVVEASPAWKDGVQITACNRSKNGYNRRDWTKHGKLPWIKYEAEKKAENSGDEFLPARGYFKKGDKGKNVEKINLFWYEMFPAYANILKRNAKNVLGPLFGENTEAWTKEFQKRTGLEPDGCIGPLTLGKMGQFGFKK